MTTERLCNVVGEVDDTAETFQCSFTMLMFNQSRVRENVQLKATKKKTKTCVVIQMSISHYYFFFFPLVVVGGGEVLYPAALRIRSFAKLNPLKEPSPMNSGRTLTQLTGSADSALRVSSAVASLYCLHHTTAAAAAIQQ